MPVDDGQRQREESAQADQPASASSYSSYDATLSKRKAVYGPNTSLSYRAPIMVVRGEGTYMFDEAGSRYLDCINNVAHLGHCHPEVSRAIGEQLATLNTNSRFLHPALPDYSARLLATFAPQPQPQAGERTGPAPAAPAAAASASADPLDMLYLVCSGSEANDLALRVVAANRPGATHVAVVAGAYHGHVASLIPLSTYKFWGRGGGGREPHVHVIPCPDPYRGENLDGRRQARAVLDEARRGGGRIGAFICESILSCGGQIFMPQGYLQGIYEEMRAEGVLCIADEVQCGFGRCGEAFWAYQTQGVQPDIVTIGKPMGNGYPVAAMVTTRGLAHGFASGGMEYFNTYGGSTAAVAAAAAVLRVLQEAQLQRHAAEVGEYLLQLLRPLVAEHGPVGDVRGQGLFLGVEVVRDKASKRHAPVTANWIKERMKGRRILLSTDGPYDNVIKMKPPMVFGRAEADVLVANLREVLEELGQPGVLAGLAREEDAFWEAVMGPRQQLYRSNELALHAPPASKL